MTNDRIPCLSLWQPWASLVVSGAKDIENRTWAPPPWVRGRRLWIHAAKRFDRGARDIGRLHPELHRAIDDASCDCIGGALLGSVCIEGFVHADDYDLPTSGSMSAWGTPTPLSPWFCGPFGWLLSDARPLPVPITMRGRQGIWWEPRPDIVEPEDDAGCVVLRGHKIADAVLAERDRRGSGSPGGAGPPRPRGAARRHRA